MPAPVSVQLYTLREEARADFPAVLARLGRIGYVGVETAGLHDLSPAEFRRHLSDAGLVVSSAHVPLPLGDAAAKVLDEQQEIGTSCVVVAFLPPDRFETEDGVRRCADELNEAHENAKVRGMSLGYHNHYWEFASRVGDRPAFDVLFERLDPHVFAEVDTYWAKVGGQDPAKVVAGLGARARLLHLKDGPADDPASPMTAVGRGSLDIAGIARANPSVEWLIVELDRCATDMFEAVEQSHRFLVGERIAEGRA
jgi:sugar phosphate isomerase/epimerase